MIGKRYLQSFGKPLSTREVHSLVTISVSKATTALFGEPRWTNPHAFRHIAAKHVRKNNGDTKKLAGLMGHSEAQGDEYANQIMTESDWLNDFSDNWWEEENEDEDN